MRIETLNELFADEIFDILDAEERMVKAIPKMADVAADSALSKVFHSHLNETKMHVDRLKKIINLLNLDRKREKCEAMKGLITEAEEMIKRIKKGPVLDAALITAAQKVEHYEIAAYGTLCALARTLGYKDAEEILKETLKEEKGADEKLTVLAEKSVNEEARKKAA